MNAAQIRSVGYSKTSRIENYRQVGESCRR